MRLHPCRGCRRYEGLFRATRATRATFQPRKKRINLFSRPTFASIDESCSNQHAHPDWLSGCSEFHARGAHQRPWFLLDRVEPPFFQTEEGRRLIQVASRVVKIRRISPRPRPRFQSGCTFSWVRWVSFLPLGAAFFLVLAPCGFAFEPAPRVDRVRFRPFEEGFAPPE
jgi:hypothetical protein